MHREQRFIVWLENVECRARPRIDLQQIEVAAANKKIGAVQATQRDLRGEPLHGFGQRVGGLGVERSGLRRAAVAEWPAWRRRRPLGAEAKDHGAPAVGEEQRGDGSALDAALKVEGRPRRDRHQPRCGCVCRLRRPCASRASLPDPEEGRGTYRDARCRSRWQSSAKARGSLIRATTAGALPTERPALRDVGEQVGPILESRAADDSGRLSRCCKAFERGDDDARAHAAGKAWSRRNAPAAAAAVSWSPKKSATSGSVSAAARRRRESAARSGRDQHCRRATH